MSSTLEPLKSKISNIKSSYYEKNKPIRLHYQKEYYKSNKDKIKKYTKKYYEGHKDILKTKRKDKIKSKRITFQRVDGVLYSPNEFIKDDISQVCMYKKDIILYFD
jgi:hypothetical protein